MECATEQELPSKGSWARPAACFVGRVLPPWRPACYDATHFLVDMGGVTSFVREIAPAAAIEVVRSLARVLLR
jgi:hypothetical protein